MYGVCDNIPEEQWEAILEDDPHNPFVEVESLYPKTLPLYTCRKCNASTAAPIAVIKANNTCLYCPSCHAWLTNANKHQRSFLHPKQYRRR